MTISIGNSAGIRRIWPYSLKTRRGLDEYGHFHAKPGEDGTNVAIFTKNPARIERIWPYLPKTRRGLDEYGHIYAKPGGNWINMAIFTKNPARIGRIWPYLSKTWREWDKYGHSYLKLAEDGINISTAFSSLAGIGEMKCVFSTYLSRTENKKAGRILSLVRIGFVWLACSTNWVDFRRRLIYGFRFFAVEANGGEVVSRNVAELATYKGHVFDQWPEGAGVVRDEYDSRLAIDLRQQVA